jgi:hypothetical protein
VNGIGFTYQVVQSPMVHKTSVSTKIDIYFALSVKVKGFLTQLKYDRIIYSLDVYQEDFRNCCVANLPHFKVEKLEGAEMLNSFKSIFCKLPETLEEDQSEPNSLLEKISISKIFVLLSFILYSDIILILLIPKYWYAIFLVNTLIIILFCFIFWRSLLYQFSRNILLETEIIDINPFTNITFYRFPTYQDMIFVYSDRNALTALTFFSVEEIFPRQFISHDHFLARLDKFFRSNISTQLPLTYTVISSPLDYSTFDKGAKGYLKPYIINDLKKREKEYERNEWLDMRNGIWRTMIVFSVSYNRFTNHLNEEILTETGEELLVKSRGFWDNFNADFTNYQLKSLSKRETNPALLTIMLKNKLFRLNGTHLNYQLLQGKTLMNLIEISHEFKKSIETRIAAEFNSPLSIKNFITIGDTLNTEFMEEEIAAGFTKEQIKKLLITNGNFMDRQNLLMKIVIELTQKNIPSIIFDYDGTFSKVIRYFRDTQFEDKFLHFKLGQNFRIDPLSTDIAYDKNKDLYLDLVVDILALVYNKKKIIMDRLREKLHSEDFSLQDLIMEKETQNRWEKDNTLDYASSELNFLRDNPSILLNNSIDNTDFSDIIVPYNFVQNNKSIIIDLSKLPDFEPKVFLSFIIMIKIQYYLLYSLGLSQPPKVYEKLFIIPNIDIAFDNKFIGNYSKFSYSSIDKFLEPIFNMDFGLISTANQLHNLHSNVFNYLENLITFRAFDKRDIAALKNLMHLQELHGTGYYSKSRKEAYQIEFLKGMKSNEVIVKRTDVNQSYPVVLDIDGIKKMEPLSKEEIIDYMNKLGYDLQDSENQILSDARKTLFEQHFGVYYKFLDEIITFFTILHKLDNIGNLYKAKIKEELLKIISLKAKNKVGNDKTRIKSIRDNIFELMLKHGYIIEAHPRKASGSQSIRPSYAIGPQYQASIDDYYEVNEEKPTKVSFDVISQESKVSENSEMFESLFNDDLESRMEPEYELEPIDGGSPFKNSNNKAIKKSLTKNMAQFFALLAEINRYINQKEYEHALSMEQNVVKTFLLEIYSEFHPESASEKPEVIFQHASEFFIDSVAPSITQEYLESLIRRSDDIEISRSDINQILLQNLNQLLHFFHRLQAEIHKL